MKRHYLPGCLAALLLAGAVATAETTNMTNATVADPNTLKGVHRICFAGDSLTDGSAWTDWVIETLKANGHPDLIKQDAGIAGDNVPKLKARFQHDVIDQKPDLVILNIGTNDKEPVEEYQKEVGDLVKQVRQTGAKMLLLIPPGINDPKDATRDARVVTYGVALKQLAAENDCTLVDLHAAFAGGARSASAAEQTAVSDGHMSAEDAIKTSRILWGPDGVHHTINGWRTMGWAVLNALGCSSPMIQKVALMPNAVTDWYIGPTVSWKVSAPYPPLPELGEKFDPVKAGWRKFDREAEVPKTSWWQRSWLERGGIMPMGQELVKDHPGVAGNGVAAFAVAMVPSDKDAQTTLHLGGSTGYAVWVNDELVYECKVLRGYHPDADRVTIKLHKGENHIVVLSNWLFYVALGDS